MIYVSSMTERLTDGAKTNSYLRRPYHLKIEKSLSSVALSFKETHTQRYGANPQHKRLFLYFFFSISKNIFSFDITFPFVVVQFMLHTQSQFVSHMYSATVLNCDGEQSLFSIEIIA